MNTQNNDVEDRKLTKSEKWQLGIILGLCLLTLGCIVFLNKCN